MEAYAGVGSMRFDAETPPPRTLLPLQVEAADIERWILSKDPRAIERWNDLGAEEHARAFTAARTAGTDIADDLYFGLVDNIAAKGTEEDFAKRVTPILRAKGWLGGNEGQIAHRVALIYDTNLRVARAAGRWERYQSTKSALPYIETFDVGDSRVRHPPKSPASDHRAWGGIILPVDHWFWQLYWTPLGFRCRCSTAQLSRSQFARRNRPITTDAELADRIARLGPPVFKSPAAPFREHLADMVAGTNAARMPDMPPVDPLVTEREGRAAWDRIKSQAAMQQVLEALDAIFGVDR